MATISTITHRSLPLTRPDHRAKSNGHIRHPAWFSVAAAAMGVSRPEYKSLWVGLN